MHRRDTVRILLVALALASFGLVGCPGPVGVTGGGAGEVVKHNQGDSKCRLQVDAVAQTKAGVNASLGYFVDVGGGAEYESFQELKSGFDEMQKDFDLMSYKLCQDFDEGRITQEYYQTRRTCMDNALAAMRVMQKDLADMKDEGAPGGEEQAWALESKLAWIRESVQCKETAGSPLASPAGGGQPAAEINLTAYLVCQRKTATGYVDVPTCDGTVLREGDRVRFGYKTDKAARIYIVAYNSTGQFQMLFPDAGIDNEVVPGSDTFVPGDDWFYLDDVKGVTEIIQVVASANKIPQLELLRGKEFPPTKKGKMAPEGMRTRGLMEPIVSRGFKKKGSKPAVAKNVGGETVDTVPMDFSFPGAAGIEFRIIHE